MSYTYKGVRANWNHSKNCWMIKFNGIIHYCFDHEVDDTIDALLDE